MIKKNILKLLAIFMIVTLPFALAAGGGGGGSSRSKPSCTEDTWSCSEWGPCKKDEIQTRTCTLTTDCPGVETAKPSEKESCTYVSQVLSSLKCHNLNTLKERVTCRLGLEENDLNRELKIAYLPEECRTITNKGEREECVLIYSRSQRCWALPIGSERTNCVNQILGITDIKIQKESCANDNACLNSLRKNVYVSIILRLYDLEERAEDLQEQGKITKEQAADIISSIEEKKVEFRKATSKEQRKQIILDAKALWQAFVTKI
ncbi:MAG: hypothetical protein AABX08_03955 [Nanoarchaeota archaeon]